MSALTQTKRFSKKSILYMACAILLYALWLTFFLGWRSDHVYFILLVLTLYFSSEWSHKLTLSLVFFIGFWLLYDGMRALLNYEVNPIHIREPYEIEKMLFGIENNGQIITPNEYWKLHYTPLLDFVTGFFYLQWMPAPLSLAVYLFFKDRLNLLHFSFAFLVTNLIGITIYYLYPAAPPWYVDLYGFEPDFSVPGNAARLLAFDDIVGIPIFGSIYNQNANVFGAIPSLHAAYPIISLYYVAKKKMKIPTYIFIAITLGTWFGAVYTMHHYIIDVLLGILCAVLALILVEKWLLKTRIQQWFLKFADYVR